MIKQKEFRLRLPESVKMSTRVRAWEEQRLNGKFTVERPDLCRKIKEGIRGICHEITNCHPAAVAGYMHPARVLRALGELIIAERLVDSIESARSDRNLANPITLADYLAALDLTLQQHRQPAGWLPQDQVSEISDRIECLAALVCKIAAVVGVEKEVAS